MHREHALPSAPGLYFDAELRPNRSLDPRVFRWLMLAVAAASFGAGAAFVSAGAWPVVGFFGLDVLLLYIAFRASYRSGNLYETVRLSEDMLEVRRVHPSGGAQTWRLPPHWLRVEIDDPPEHDSQLTLSTHGRRVTVGAFLTPEERAEVAAALQAALDRVRMGVRAGAPA